MPKTIRNVYDKAVSFNNILMAHKLRMCRNGFQHPEREQISFDKTTIEEWRDIVFSIKEKK